MLTQNSVIDDVCGLIGFSATVRLIEWYGGRHVYVPEVPSDDHPLALLLGATALRALSRDFGSSMIWVPKDVSGKRRQGIRTKKNVARLLNRGCIVEQVALELGLSARQVQRISTELLKLGLISCIPTAPRTPAPSTAPVGPTLVS